MIENKRFKVHYNSYVIRDNDYVRRRGFSCITFENRGDVPVLIDDAIYLGPNSEDIIEFNERPDTVIEHEFEIKFDREAAGKRKLLVIEAYYEEIKA